MRSAPTESSEGVDARAAALASGARWRLPVGVALASTVLFVLAKPHLIDDTFITLSYAKNLAFHGHWGLIEQGTANTATSPLNVMVLAALTTVVRDAVLAAGVLFVACQVVLATGLRRLGTRAGLPAWFAPLAVGLLLVNPLLISSIGLEVTIGAAAVVWLLIFSVERRPAAFGVLVGLIAVIRLDLLVLVAVIFFLRRDFWVGIWRCAFAALAVMGPWFLFSWSVLGSAVPDTLIIKTLQGSWGPWDFTNGPVIYWRHFPLSTTLSFLPLLAGGAIGVGWLIRWWRGSETARTLQPFAVLAVAGAVHYVAYSWLGVPPYHWYYGPSIACATVFVAAAVTVPGRLRKAAATAATALVVTGAVVYLLPGVPRPFAPIMSNHASSARYQEIGAQLRTLAHGQIVRSGGEIGALAYYCDCDLVDILSDRGSLNSSIAASKGRNGPLGRALIEANFRFLDRSVPPAAPELALHEVAGAPPPGALASWAISSAWTGAQTLYLSSAADAPPR